MPADTYTLNRTKDLIISFIRARGPSLPVHIARDVKISPLFAAAFLSELYGEGKVKMSALKVGSSSLYYLHDQESQLENFIEHLAQREKEAFSLLKARQLLDDEALEPVMRVALRSLRDFAIPLRFSHDSKPRFFWRYSLLSEEEAQQRITALLEPTPPAPLAATASAPAPEPASPTTKQRTRAPRRAPVAKPAPLITLPLPSAAPTPPAPSPFAERIHQHLKARQLALLETLSDKKKEYVAKIALETPLGPQHLYLIAKDKKRLKAEELIAALQQAHAEKMPALVISRDVEKKALPLLQEWSALLKFEKLT